VYLTWADSVFLAFFSFNTINNLRGFNVVFSSIPTALTNHLPVQTGISRNPVLDSFQIADNSPNRVGRE